MENRERCKSDMDREKVWAYAQYRWCYALCLGTSDSVSLCVEYSRSAVDRIAFIKQIFTELVLQLHQLSYQNVVVGWKWGG